MKINGHWNLLLLRIVVRSRLPRMEKRSSSGLAQPSPSSEKTSHQQPSFATGYREANDSDDTPSSSSSSVDEGKVDKLLISH